MRALFVSKDKGNALAGADVAQKFLERGVSVTYMLDSRGSSADSYSHDPSFRSRLDGVSVMLSDTHDVFVHPTSLALPDFVFVTLSASGRPNAEIPMVALISGARPVYGLEEVIGGRHNPGWEEERPYPVTLLRRLFTALPTDEDAKYPNVTVVGPPQLDRYRGMDIEATGREARRKLGIGADQAIVFYTGHPEPENPHVLSRVGEALACLCVNNPALRKEIVLVVARHGRERNKPVPDNAAAHRHTLRLILERVRVRIVENSLDHQDLPSSDPEAIPEEFRPAEFATYQELVCACKVRGVVVTGFGNDGQVVAPHLGVPSILFLDHCSYLFGGLHEREKRMRYLPLPLIPQVPTTERLVAHLEQFLVDPLARERHVVRLREVYPFPERDPAEIIVDHILKDLEPPSAA